MQKSKIIMKLIIACIFMMLFLACDLFLPESYAAVSTKILKGTLSGTKTYHVGGTGLSYSGTDTIYTDLGDKTSSASSTSEELHIAGDITFIVEYNYINVRNKIVIDNGGKLTIKFSDKFTANGGKFGNSAFQRYIKGDYPYNSDLLWVSEGGELDISGNNTSERVVISGGYQFQIIKEERNDIEGLPATAYDKTNGTSYEPGVNYTETNANYTFKAYSGLIRIVGGKAVLNNVMLVHNRTESTDTGGAIHIAGKSPELKLENSVITKCYTATAGSAIYLNSSEGGNAIVKNCQIYECFSENGNRIRPNTTYTSGGGTIRCIGQNKCKLKLICCDIYNNYNQACGAITWNAGQIDPLEMLGCNIYKNTSDSGAAGVYCASRAIIDGYDNNGTIRKTKIYNNWAKSTGGGLSITTWSSDGNLTDMKLEKGTITLSDKVEITGNYAGTNGGGIHFDVKRIATNLGKGNDFYYDYDKDGNPYEMSLNINGATISDNYAGTSGGGIYITKSHLFYDVKLHLNSGIVANNNAGYMGGGIFVTTADNATTYSDEKYPNHNTLTEVNVGSESNNLVISNNNTKTHAGGGIALNGGKIIITNGTIIGNTAATYGGGVYVGDNEWGADILIKGGEISENFAKDGGGCAVQANNFKIVEATIEGGVISNNKATNNGGAIYVEKGDLHIYGNCQMQESTAKYGGAVCVSGGNVDITGGTIKNSKAISGGGVYISNGNITMNGGNISNNQADEYGGGIYAASEEDDLKVTITSGTVSGNIASLDGGGIGVNTGEGIKGIITIGLEECEGVDKNHSHPIIKDNTANGNGGGFWLNGDDMTMNMYCGSIKENIAVLEPGSANIYQTGGTATVHHGEVGEGVIVIGGEYVYIPENQIPEITIIYDSNNPDKPEQKTALVTIGVEIFLPKNLFTREGYVLVGWAHKPNPTVNDTIYTVGEPYLVGDEDITVYAVWLLEGVGTIETPGIQPGKYFDEVTNGTNIILASNSSFTTQMTVLEIQPNYYNNRTLMFDKVVPNGTNITMIDFSNTNKKEFYYYKVENDKTKTIELSEFTKNGTNEKYINSTATELIDEKFLFVVELPKDNTETGARQITLIRNSADSKIAAIEQTTTYTMAEKRSFKLSYEDDSGIFEEPSIEDTLTIAYEKGVPVGNDTRYNDKELSLIVMSDNEFSEDIKLFDGTNYYLQNGKKQFIIPFGNINEDKKINLQLVSNILKENEFGYDFKVELIVSNDKNKPCMGEKVTEIENIELGAIELPAIKIELDKNSYNQEEFSSGELKLDYETKKLDDYTITIELQKKVSSNSYVTQTDLLSSVDENSENTNGVFGLDLNSSGNIDLEFVDGFENQSGTYRILLKASDTSGNEIEAPCNFMIVE